MTKCAICGKRKCVDNTTKHLLGSFDSTYDGQGLHGAGLSGGALYNVEEIGELLHAIREAKVASWPNGGLKAAPPPWIAAHSALLTYFTTLGDDDFNLAEFEDLDQAASFIAASTTSHGQQVRELLADLLESCGWSGIDTEEDDGSMAPAHWLLWWDDDAEGVARRLGEMIRKLEPVSGPLSGPLTKTNSDKGPAPTVHREKTADEKADEFLDKMGL